MRRSRTNLLGVDTGLGTGKGLFDPVINEQVGLPGAAGVNRAEFSIDIETLPYDGPAFAGPSFQGGLWSR